MGNFTETDSFDTVHILDTTEQVLGGTSGAPANIQAQALSNRTAWLKNRLGGNSGVVSINLTADATSTLLIGSMGNLIKISIANNIYATLTLVLPIGLKSGQKFLLYIQDSDLSIAKVLVNGGVFYNNEVIEIVANGDDTYTNIPITFSQKTKSLFSGTESIDSTYARVRIPAISGNVYVNDSSSLFATKLLSEIKLVGDATLRQDFKITVFFPSKCTIVNTGNIIINGTNQLVVRDAESIDFIWNQAGLSNYWTVFSAFSKLDRQWINNGLTTSNFVFAGATNTYQLIRFRKRGAMVEFNIKVSLTITDATAFNFGTFYNVSSTISQIATNYLSFYDASNYNNPVIGYGNASSTNDGSAGIYGKVLARLNNIPSYNHIGLQVKLTSTVSNGNVIYVDVSGSYELK